MNKKKLFDYNLEVLQVSQLAAISVFDFIAKKYEIAIVFLHHLNKSADESRVHKGDATGSAAFEQKMRSIISLTKSGYTDTRYLQIVKGNYASNGDKKARHKLKFDQNDLQFQFIESENVDFESEEISESDKKEVVKFLLDNHIEERGKGLSYLDAPASVFEQFGIERRPSALHAWVKRYKTSILGYDREIIE